MTLTMGGSGGVQPTARLALADLDGTLVSGFLSTALQQGPLADLIELESVPDEAAGLERVKEGAVSGFLLIPAGFSEAVLGQTQTTLELVKNPAQRILPEVLEETLQLLIDALFYADQLMGEEIQQIYAMSQQSGAPELAQVAALSTAISTRISELGGMISPPLIELKTVSPEPSPEEAGPSNSPSITLLFFPGILLMGVLFASQGMSEDIWREQETGTLKRLVSSPSSLTDFLIAKLMAAGVLVGASTGLVLLLGTLYHGIPILKLPFALLWLMLSGVAFSGLMTSIQLFMPSKRAGMLLTSFLVFPLMMAGGSFFPFEAMPGWMARIGQWTPNGILLQHLKDFFFDRADGMQLATGVTLLLVVTTALAILASWRVSRFARGEA